MLPLSTSCWLCQRNLTKGKTKRRKTHSDINTKTVNIIESTCQKKLGIDIRATNFIVADYVCHKCVLMVEAVDVSIKLMYILTIVRASKSIGVLLKTNYTIRVSCP